MSPAKTATQKTCIDCAQPIPVTAAKCAKCGSFQDWRRHLTSGQNALALVISLIALVTTVALNGLAVSGHVQSAVFPETNLQLGVAQIDMKEASLVVTNPTSRPTVINSLSCTIWAPIGREWLERGDWGLGKDIWPTKKESIGVFLVSYRPSESVMLSPGAQQALVAGVEHIAPPRPQGGSDELARAGCFLGSVNDRNELVVGAAMLNPNDLVKFDALEMVGAADYSPLQQDQLASDKARIAAHLDGPVP